MQVFNFALAQNFNSEHEKERADIISGFGAWVVAGNSILLLETESSLKSPYGSGGFKKLLSSSSSLSMLETSPSDIPPSSSSSTKVA